jgi:glycosyltransferase involved in cell wall biosynthesis
MMEAETAQAARPLRILIAIGVSRQKEAGAAGVVLANACELEKRGHKVDCWFLEDVLASPANSKRFEALSFAIALAKRIRREREKYDVVNVHAPYGCVYGIFRRLFRHEKLPAYVMTMQGSEDRYVRMMGGEHRKGRAWHFGLRNRLWHRAYHQTMYSYSIRTADYGTVANREAWICAELKYGVEPGKIRFVPNGVEERFFAEREYKSISPMRLLYVGTWLDRKGIYYLADAFDILCRANPSVSLTVAGCGGSDEYIKSFFASGVRDRVNVIPFIARDHMPALYAGHDVFVFPSLFEGMPLTLLEAMASGMPVVTTSTSGMADVVEDGFNGLLVPPADAEAIAESTSRFCSSTELRCQLGREARNTMRRYTWAKVTRPLEEVLTIAARLGAPTN